MNKTNFNISRRRIIINSIYGLSAYTAMSLLGSCKGTMSGEITAVEDLMREHGIIRRIMLIYDACRLRLIENEPVDPQVLKILKKALEFSNLKNTIDNKIMN